MPELVDRFNWVAQPYLKRFPLASCIEQSRILVEVLPEFGAKVEAIEATMIVRCGPLNLAYISGADPEERARGKAIAGTFLDRTTPEGEGYGHVVVAAEIAGRPYLLDPTMSQASMPDRDFLIPRGVLAIGPLSQRPAPDCQIEAGFVLDDGKEVTTTWNIKETRNFERTQAWEPSHLWSLIHHIIREMEWAASVETRRKTG